MTEGDLKNRGSGVSGAGESDLHLVRVDELRGPEATSTCLRPLGLCELGGACESCWYRPDHPRFARK